LEQYYKHYIDNQSKSTVQLLCGWIVDFFTKHISVSLWQARQSIFWL